MFFYTDGLDSALRCTVHFYDAPLFMRAEAVHKLLIVVNSSRRIKTSSGVPLLSAAVDQPAKRLVLLLFSLTDRLDYQNSPLFVDLLHRLPDAGFSDRCAKTFFKKTSAELAAGWPDL
ncbi:hypothetical protein [Brevibacillus gelatini]